MMGASPDPGIDWELVNELARRHGVSPFLYRSLYPHQADVPPDVWLALRSNYYASVARHLFRERELEQVLEVLDGAGVPIVLLKGTAWARTVYPDPVLRTMGDLDLWLPRHSLDEARNALGKLGYVAHSKDDRPLALQDEYLGETQLLSDKPGSGLVELHWNVFPGEWLRHAAQIDESPVWERCVPIDGTKARQLASEDAVLNACLHLVVNHQMGGVVLRPLLDLEQLYRELPIDWSIVLQRARDWRVTTATWLLLDLWAKLFDRKDDIPLSELCPSSFRQRILQRLIPVQLLMEGKTLRRGWERRIFLLFLVDRPADAVRLLWRAFFPERQWITLLYGLEGAPTWRIRLQQLYHPFRVLIRRDV